SEATTKKSHRSQPDTSAPGCRLGRRHCRLISANLVAWSRWQRCLADRASMTRDAARFVLCSLSRLDCVAWSASSRGGAWSSACASWPCSDLPVNEAKIDLKAAFVGLMPGMLAMMMPVLLAVVMRNPAGRVIIHSLALFALGAEMIVHDVPDFRIRAGAVVRSGCCATSRVTPPRIGNVPNASLSSFNAA